MTARVVVVVGMMGSGKTTVGSALAARLGWPYWDNDAELRALAGAGPAEVLARDGADELHRLEGEVLRRALALPGPMVVSAPGSAVLDPALRAALAGEQVVWLRATVETLAARVVADPARPFLAAGEVGPSLASLAAEREPSFAEVADVVVDVDGRTPGDIVDEIAGAITTTFA